MTVRLRGYDLPGIGLVDVEGLSVCIGVGGVRRASVFRVRRSLGSRVRGCWVLCFFFRRLRWRGGDERRSVLGFDGAECGGASGFDGCSGFDEE